MIIESLDSKIHPHVLRLQFECTNNEVEYEDLIQGLELKRHMGIIFLYIFAYLDIVFNHVKNKHGIKKCWLKEYIWKVWDLINIFEAFNIKFIHREKNHREDSLAVSVSMFIHDDFGK